MKKETTYERTKNNKNKLPTDPELADLHPKNFWLASLGNCFYILYFLLYLQTNEKIMYFFCSQKFAPNAAARNQKSADTTHHYSHENWKVQSRGQRTYVGESREWITGTNNRLS